MNTEQAYQSWLRRYWGFLQAHRGQADYAKLAPAAKVKGFLEYLAVERHVAASTQKQALNALVFFYKEVMARPGSEHRALDLNGVARLEPEFLLGISFGL